MDLIEHALFGNEQWGGSPQINTAHQKQGSMLKNHKINYVFIFSILYHLSKYETKLGLACFCLFCEIFEDMWSFVTP